MIAPDVLLAGHDCCPHHTLTCEPPSELCCPRCAEGSHPDHPARVLCVLDVAAIVAEHTGAATTREAQTVVDGLRVLLPVRAGEVAPADRQGRDRPPGMP